MKGVLLMGLTASGKTTVGRHLAKSLSLNFVDLDELIAEKVGMSVRTFYEKFGRKTFQEVETIVLKDYLELQSTVAKTFLISSGGGLIENVSALALLNLNANIQIFFLHNRPKILFNRLLKRAKKEHSFPAFLKVPILKKNHSQIKYARKKFLSICKTRMELLKTIDCVKVKTKGLNAKKLTRAIKKLL